VNIFKQQQKKTQKNLKDLWTFRFFSFCYSNDWWI